MQEREMKLNEQRKKTTFLMPSYKLQENVKVETKKYNKYEMGNNAYTKKRTSFLRQDNQTIKASAKLQTPVKERDIWLN